jgi:hypothetical protein
MDVLMGRVPPKVLAKKQLARDSKKPSKLKGKAFKVLRDEIARLCQKTNEKYGLKVQHMRYELTLNGVLVDDLVSCSPKGLVKKLREVYYDLLVNDDEVMNEVDSAIAQGDYEDSAIDELLDGELMDAALNISE